MHELDRRQVGQLVVGYERDGWRRLDAAIESRRRQGSVRRVRGCAGEHLVAALASRPVIHRHGAGDPEARHPERGHSSIGRRAALRDRRWRHLDRLDVLDDAGLDGHARALRQRLDHCSVDTSGLRELALVLGVGSADETPRIVEHHSREHDLDEVGLDRVGVEHVDRQHAAPQVRSRQRVHERVSVLAGDGLIEVPDADPCLVAEVEHLEIVGCIWRARHDVDRPPDVVRNVPLVAVVVAVAEVLVERLGEVKAVRSLG
jgi:hypothetical protein